MSTNMSDHLEEFESVLTAFFKELKKEDFDKEPFIVKDQVKTKYQNKLKEFLEEKKVNDHSSETQKPYDKLFNEKFEKWWVNN